MNEESFKTAVTLTAVLLLSGIGMYLFIRWLIQNPGLSVTTGVFGVIVPIIGAVALLLRFISGRFRKRGGIEIH